MIQDPYVYNGFIAVQVVKPKYKVSNFTYEVGQDIYKTNFESDEAREAGLLKKQNNDTFRMTANHYGQV